MKKAFLLEDFDPIGTSTQGDTVNATSAFCEEFLDVEDLGEHTFSLNLSIENLVQPKERHSTAISDEEDDEFQLKPNQGHDTLIKEDNADVNMLKARIISLEIAMLHKDSIPVLSGQLEYFRLEVSLDTKIG